MRNNILKVSGPCIAWNVIPKWKESCILRASTFIITIVGLLLNFTNHWSHLISTDSKSVLDFDCPGEKWDKFLEKIWFVRVGHLVSPTEEHLFVFLFSCLTYELVQVSAEVESCNTLFIKKDEWKHHKFYSQLKVIHILPLTNQEKKRLFFRLLFNFMLL